MAKQRPTRARATAAADTSPGGILICRPVSLPDHRLIEAADYAGRINPANLPYVPADRSIPSPARLAAMTGKFWQPGQTLEWCFLDNADPETRRLMAEAYARWAQYVKLKFVETSNPGNAQFRWARLRGEGYWSMVGTDCGLVPRGEPNGNLDSFNSKTPMAEWRRVADHEIGHELGFGHTQLLPEFVEKIDPQKAYRYFARTQGWSKKTVDDNVLKPYRPGEVSLKNVSLTSVMMYGLPQEIMKPGFPAIPGGNGIEPADGQTAAKIYSGKVDPVPPPQPGGPIPLVIGGPAVEGTIGRPGEIDDFLIEVAERGTYKILAEPPMEIGIFKEDGTGSALDSGFETPPQQRLKPGRYRVKVMHHRSGGTGGYRIRAEKVSG